jgi:hypothetical protein
MIFEVVNHTYRYHRLLAYQLSSFIMNPPVLHNVVYTVFYDAEDTPTVDTVNHFEPLMPSTVDMVKNEMHVDYLRNRAIGRNIAAKATAADWVWFTDTDYCFGHEVWNRLALLVENTSSQFLWPSYIYETDWAYGDELIGSMATPQVKGVEYMVVPQVRMRRGIGGIQIAKGDRVREIGYCPSYEGPRKDWDFSSDVRFRRQFKDGERSEINLRNVCRIRHSQKGYRQENRDEVVN